MVGSLACVRNGTLLLLDQGQPPRELVSPYAEQVRTRELSMQRRNAWKQQGTGAQFMGVGQRVLWGQAEVDVPPARISGISRGREPGELFYAVSTGVVSGIFAQTPPGPDEQRLFHAADVDIGELTLSVDDAAIACSVAGKGGASAIALLEDDGRGVRTITEGDVVDRGPRWVPGGRGEIVYASAGVGRTREGHFAGLAPFALHRLTLTSGAIETVCADPKYDYVAPVPAASDVFYAIRRPYRDPHAPPSLFRIVFDAILAPFRLVFALFAYLNFFTARYTGKPLLTSGNARQKAADAKQMMVWGNLVSVAQQAGLDQNGQRAESERTSYELVRIDRQGVSVVTRGVLAFDLGPDGTIVYSTGREIMRLANGKPEVVAEVAEVEQLVLVR